MLSIHATDAPKCTPNLLPARINHNGPIENAERYWRPKKDDKGNYHAYLRGRHLHGTSQPLPQGYTGAVLSVTDKQLQQSRPKPQAIEDDEDGGENAVEEQDVEVYIAEQVGEFDEFIVWGHGGQVDGAQDGYVRGMKEWITFSESMHVDDEEHVATEKKYS